MRTHATTLAAASAPQCVPIRRAPAEVADDAQARIDFPLAPDDVRLRAQTSRRREGGAYARGLVGLAAMVLGVAGLAVGGYLALDAAAEVEDSPAADSRRGLGYGLGGFMGLLSMASTTFGFSQICLCMKKRREASEASISQHMHVRFSTRPREDDAHDYA